MSRRWLLLFALAVRCQCGGLEVSPAAIDFGTVAADSSAERDVTVTNHAGGVDAKISLDPDTGDPGLFQIDGATHYALLSGDSHAFHVVLAPPSDAPAKRVSARLVVNDEMQVMLTGEVTNGSGAGGGAASGGGGTSNAGGGTSGSGGGTSGSGGGASSSGGGTSGSGGGASSSGGGTSSAGGGTSSSGGGTSGSGGGTSSAGGGTSSSGGGTSGSGGGTSACGSSCTSWVDCTNPGEGCDSARGCCVPCGGTDQPCCVDFNQGFFFCGGTQVCGRSSGFGTGETYYCCENAGDGCCEQGGCFGGTVCSCPRNGLNFCVQPEFVAGTCQ